MPRTATATAPSTANAPVPRPPPTRLPGGLRYVNPDMPGLTRERQGDAFRYRQPDGKWLTDPDEISRIQKLAIPPAYTDVWICPLANGHLQATGLDARGRRQYRYHADWRLQRDEAKFERMQAFGRALPRIRARVARDLRATPGRALSRERVLATLVRLLDTTFMRVGNEEYASANRSYGLTTLRNRHADLRGNRLRLRFRGKSGVQQEATLDDPRVARVVRRCQQLPGQELFQYEDEDGTLHAVDSGDVNDYLREITGTEEGEHFTAKDFRTWHGTVQALELTRLACSQQPGTPAVTAKHILAEVARQLGNTPAVCKKSYVHPSVLDLGSRLTSDAGPDMQVLWDRIGGTNTPRALQAAERRLLAFLRQKDRPTRAKRARKTTH
ncbi:DNA topoisomerase IB [Paracidovorax valerianellae]|uniref:DNA topoisomerase IB n=1 Tax=Paracidovorax valerianellae TaxID=187868 RepID=UPI0023036024|nr:DNA topoisomerase IB [Paracidovorax valerianellae]MDA8446521.1 DNA topoisomerase IB [Paracidovorax valerianellae]